MRNTPSTCTLIAASALGLLYTILMSDQLLTKKNSVYGDKMCTTAFYTLNTLNLLGAIVSDIIFFSANFDTIFNKWIHNHRKYTYPVMAFGFVNNLTSGLIMNFLMRKTLPCEVAFAVAESIGVISGIVAATRYCNCYYSSNNTNATYNHNHLQSDVEMGNTNKEGILNSNSRLARYSQCTIA